jgi:uncharacterized protein YyaL (SSP411 family)
MMRALVFSALLAALAPRAEAADFEGWTAEAFARARHERRIVVLVVSTTWCHWCHVMRRETWEDARVEARLARGFLPILVDGDARPDLEERFRLHRWPATVFLTPEAEPVLALRGHVEPGRMLRVLDDVEARVRAGGPYEGGAGGVDEGSRRGASATRSLAALRRDLVRRLDATWDPVAAGWGTPQKYPVAEAVEHGLLLGRLGRGAEGDAWRRSLRTLDAQRALIDPVWGGMFQYSTHGDWRHPHYERITYVNAGAMGAYADAHAITGDARWLADARAIHRWVTEFLRLPSGAFASSQDADPPGGVDAATYHAMSDAQRRRIGTPRVDPAVYARENGLTIQALCRLHAATDDPRVLAQAVRAARAVLATHRDPKGGLRHAVGDDERLYLADQAEFGRACLALARETGDARWIREARRIARAMDERLADPRGGYADATPDPVAGGAFARPLRSLEPGAGAARFLLALARATGEERHRERALGAIRAVARPAELDRNGRFVAALLVAVEEAVLAGARIDVRGASDDPSARALFEEGRRLARRRPGIEVVWTRTGAEVARRAHATVCSDDACSRALHEPERIAPAVRALLRKE